MGNPMKCNRNPCLFVYCAALWTVLACSSDSPTETAKRGRTMTALDVPALQLRGLKPNAWDTDDSRLTAAIRSADGYGVVAFKSPSSRRTLESNGFRAAVPATVVDEGIALLKSRDVEVISLLSSMGAARVRFTKPELAAALRSDPLIDYVAPRVRLNMTMTPNVEMVRGGTARPVAPFAPIVQAQMAEVVPWGVTMIRAPESWSTTTGNSVKVMFLVPGGPGPHADLPAFDPNHCGGPYWHVCDGWDGTGLFLYGQIAEPADQWGIVGVAPSAPVANLYAWNPCAQNSTDPLKLDCYDDQMASGIDAAVLVGAKLFTFGTFAWDGVPSAFLPNAVARGWDADIVFVASAGTTNAYSNSIYPALYPNVVGISGVTETRAFAAGRCTYSDGTPFGSTYGPDVDVAAPFVGLGPWPTNAYQNYCGAGSMTDYTLGVLMLIRSANPTWTKQQVVDRLYATATDCGPAGRDDQFGNGVVDAAAALGILPRQTCSSMPLEPGITSGCVGPYTHERIYYTYVTLTQNSPGTTLTLQRQINGTWTTIATWANAASGTYTKTRAGNGSFRANANNGSVSSPWTATITRSCG